MLDLANFSDERHIKDIIESTIGVVFFATPHLGSQMANAGEIVRQVASATLRIDSNDQLLDSLKLFGGDGHPSQELVQTNEHFRVLWGKYKFTVQTRQENISIANELVGIW
jgi:hypothetical protein